MMFTVATPISHKGKKKMTDYWFNRANKFKADIEHIKYQIENDTTADKAALKKIKDKLVDELMICHEAIERFEKAVG